MNTCSNCFWYDAVGSMRVVMVPEASSCGFTLTQFQLKKKPDDSCSRHLDYNQTKSRDELLSELLAEPLILGTFK